MKDLFLTVITTVLCGNFVFGSLLGLDSVLGESQKASRQILRNVITAVLMIPAAVGAYFLQNLLGMSGVEYLGILIFAVIFAVLEILAEIVQEKLGAAEGKTAGTGIFLNCAMFAVIYFAADCRTSEESLLFGVLAGAGFLAAALILSGVRARLETSDIPESFRGLPILVIAAGLCAMIFTGFAGLSF